MVIKSLNRVFAHAVLLTLVGWSAPGPAHGADALVAVLPPEGQRARVRGVLTRKRHRA
jgi:hypothetical protein